MRKSHSPLGTCQTPPFVMANLVPATSTATLPKYTKKTICILREFLVRLKPRGGSSMMPVPKKGIVSVLA